MTDREFFNLVRKAVAEKAGCEVADVYLVWYCKTLQNWKALASTTLPDGRYYEATLNGDKHEMYLDTYVKEDNRVVNYD